MPEAVPTCPTLPLFCCFSKPESGYFNELVLIPFAAHARAERSGSPCRRVPWSKGVVFASFAARPTGEAKPWRINKVLNVGRVQPANCGLVGGFRLRCTRPTKFSKTLGRKVAAGKRIRRALQL